MGEITASQVKTLRERTGSGMMACKKALQAVDGDLDQAVAQLRQSGNLSAASRAARPTGEGVVAARVDATGRSGVLVEVNCETDFVARGEDFLSFVERVLAVGCARPAAVDALSEDASLQEARAALVQKVGENISVRRALALSAPDDGALFSYVHGAGRIGVLVALSPRPSDAAGNAGHAGKELAMHVAASAPWVLSGAQMPASLLDAERAIYVEQARSSGKPDNIVEKMVAGKLRKFEAQHSLLSQPFVMDPDTTVGDWLRKAGLTAVAFRRYAVGEEDASWEA